MSFTNFSYDELFEWTDRLRELDVKLFLDGDILRYNAPKGVLDDSMLSRLKAGKKDLIEFLKLQRQVSDQLEEPIPLVPGTSGYPLSFAQQRFWFLDQLAGGNSPIYNMLPIAFQVDGPLRVESIEKALSVLVSRHKVLSNRFSIEGAQPRQWPGQPGNVPVTIYDLSGDKKQTKKISQIILEEGERPFDLASGGPLLRIGLIKLAEQRHILVLTLHHIVSDGWSLGNLVTEFSQLYQAAAAGETLRLPPLPIQYGDFAAWERTRLNDFLLRRYLHFWRRELNGAPVLLELPTDRPRPRLQSYNGHTHAFMLDKEQANQVQEYANRHGATPFMVLLSVFGILLSRYSRQEDLVIGSPLSVRVHPQCEPLVGLFLNTIPLRIDLTGTPNFAELLSRVKQKALAAYEQGEVPFDELLQELNIDRALNHTPLFQVLFALQNAPVGQIDTGELTLTPMEPENSKAPFDLVLSMEEIPEGIRGRFRYNTDLFDLQTIARMGRYFRNILTAALKQSDEPVKSLAMTGESEQGQLLSMNGDVETFPVDESLPELIEQQAFDHPEAIALSCDGVTWSYDQLDKRANCIARHLQGMGIQPGDRVGICMNRSAELVASILGILKAGAAYVPLDPAYPRERLDFMVKDAAIQVVITEPEAVESVPESVLHRLDVRSVEDDGEYSRSSEIPVNPSATAYVIYTSGSTGLPKGVEVTHANVIRLFRSTESLFGFTDRDVWTLFHSCAFDFSVWEIFGALLYGGKLVVVPYWVSRSPDAFYDLLQKECVTVLNQTPSAFRQLVEIDRREGGRSTSLKWVIFGGEALEMKSLEGWCRRHGFDQPHLINMYGITETTVHVTWHRITPSDLSRGMSVIGKPIADLTVDLFDEFGAGVPTGIPGEIFVGGAGVASGYLNRPELTRERFVEAEEYGFKKGGKLYRSGDLGRRLEDGTLEYLGRIDQQVKIRGFRIELGEIESQMSGYTGVASSVVVAREVDSGNELIGYVVLQSDTGEHRFVSKLRNYLKEKLPDYMLPAAIVVLEEIPLTPNGKVDRGALPDPDREVRIDEIEYIVPSSPLEMLIARLWQEVLQISKIGLKDNFFELGGDSIKGAIFANKMQKEIGSVFYVVSLFEAPTITGLIDYMRIHYPEAVVKFKGGNGVDADPGSEERELESSDLATFRKAIEPLNPFPSILKSRKNKRAVFVLAPPRSGTTLLRVLLGGHSRLFAPPELELMPFNTLKERNQIHTGRNTFWLEGTLRAVMELQDIDAEAAKELMAEREASGMSIKDFYGEIQKWMGDRILVDKSPSYVLDPLILKRIEDTFEDPLYIHLHRHPMGMIHSFEEAKLHQIFFRYPHSFTPKQLAELIWLHSHHTVSDFLTSIPAERQITVGYEKLTRSAEQEVERMCGFIDVDFEPEMLAIYEEGDKKERMTDGIYEESRMLGDVKFHTHNRIDASAAERWRNHYRKDFLAWMTWDLAQSLGYEPFSPPIQQQPEKASSVTPLTVETGPIRELSLSQQRLWFFDQLEGPGSTYNMPVALWLTGPLDTRALLKALQAIPDRHEVLRSTIITEDGVPVCRIRDELPPPFVVDLTLLEADQREREASAWLDFETTRPFDLANGPLFRAGLVKLEAERHLLMITMHHIVSDGWSLGIVSRELEHFYKAFSGTEEVGIEPLVLQYHDYALWQKKLLKEGEIERQLSYWKGQLQDIPELLELPADRPRPVIKSNRGKTHRFTIEADLAKKLKKLADESGCTLYMVLLAAFGLLMNRYSGQDVIPVGSPVANRRNIDFEPLIGFFVNTLVMKVTVDGEESFEELLKKIRRVALDAYAHQDLSFEQIVEELQPQRNLGYSPLFQVMMTMQSTGIVLPELGDAQPEVADYTNTVSKYDLTLLFSQVDEGLQGFLEYSTDLYDEWRMKQLGENLTELLRQIVTKSTVPVKQLSWMPAVTRNKMIMDWNCTATDWPYSETLSAVIGRQAAKDPLRTALECGAEVLSYGELEQRSNRLAHRLLSLGLKKESRVAVALERSPEMVVTLLAILKAGCCYVPLDPGYPANRIEMIFEDAGIEWLVTHSNIQPLMPSCKNVVIVDEPHRNGTKLPDTPPEVDVSDEDLAYVIFTSGSTGRPKGVMIPHRSLLNFIFSMTRDPGLTADDSILAVTTIAFDIAVLELWAPLTVGAKIVIATEREVRDGRALSQLLDEQKITIMQGTPATWRLLIDSGWQGTPGLKSFSGGEALQRQLSQELLDKCGEVWNLYGPTETTVYSAIHRIQEDSTSNEVVEPIGKPIANTFLYILDDEFQPLPPGIPGELYIGGHGVAMGYLNQPAMTSERFLKNPFDEIGRIYRTGDLARYRPDGTVEYLGRMDQQVKVRGFRIELGEIESQLQQMEAIAECAVVLYGEGLDVRLVAFYVVRNGFDVQQSELTTFLAENLPDYMVPATFFAQEALPLTPNGKLDRKTLTASCQRLELETPGTSGRAPRDLTELGLLKIWEDLLGRQSLGTDDNFFDVGGHSLTAVRLMARIASDFGQHLPLAALFHSPSISELARHLKKKNKTGGWETLVKISRGDDSTSPLFCAPGAGGNVLYFQPLSQFINPDIPFYGLQPAGLDGSSAVAGSVEELAAQYITAIQSVDPLGPYRLAGHSFGGLVVFEMARQLIQQDYSVEQLVLLDTPAPQWFQPTGLDWSQADWLAQVAQIASHQYGVDLNLTRQKFTESDSEEKQLLLLQQRLIECGVFPPDAEIDHLRGFIEVYRTNLQMSYKPNNRIEIHTDLLVIRSADLQPEQLADEQAARVRSYYDLGWKEWVHGSIDVIEVPGDHLTMLNLPHVQDLANALNRFFEQKFMDTQRIVQS